MSSAISAWLIHCERPVPPANPAAPARQAIVATDSQLRLTAGGGLAGEAFFVSTIGMINLDWHSEHLAVRPAYSEGAERTLPQLGHSTRIGMESSPGNVAPIDIYSLIADTHQIKGGAVGFALESDSLAPNCLASKQPGQGRMTTHHILVFLARCLRDCIFFPTSTGGVFPLRTGKPDLIVQFGPCLRRLALLVCRLRVSAVLLSTAARSCRRCCLI